MPNSRPLDRQPKRSDLRGESHRNKRPVRDSNSSLFYDSRMPNRFDSTRGMGGHAAPVHHHRVHQQPIPERSHFVHPALAPAPLNVNKRLPPTPTPDHFSPSKRRGSEPLHRSKYINRPLPDLPKPSMKKRHHEATRPTSHERRNFQDVSTHSLARRRDNVLAGMKKIKSYHDAQSSDSGSPPGCSLGKQLIRKLSNSANKPIDQRAVQLALTALRLEASALDGNEKKEVDRQLRGTRRYQDPYARKRAQKYVQQRDGRRQKHKSSLCTVM